MGPVLSIGLFALKAAAPSMIRAAGEQIRLMQGDRQARNVTAALNAYAAGQELYHQVKDLADPEKHKEHAIAMTRIHNNMKATGDKIDDLLQETIDAQSKT